MNNDAVTIAPHIHSIIFENERVRMLDVRMNPGDKASMHTHPENIIYIIAGGLLRFTDDHGQFKDVQLVPGQVVYAKTTTHAVEHIGDTPLKAIQIEWYDTNLL